MPAHHHLESMHLPCSNFDAVIYRIGSYKHHQYPSKIRFYSLNTLKNSSIEKHTRNMCKEKGKDVEKIALKIFEGYSTKMESKMKNKQRFLATTMTYLRCALLMETRT